MKAIIVDDEPLSAAYLEQVCLEVPGLTVAGVFTNAVEALDYLARQDADLALMDIEMPGMTGLEAVRQMRRLRPSLAVVFVTGYEEYALDAFRVDAVAYLLKPCNSEDLCHAVEKAGKLLPPTRKRLRIDTFGYFAVFIDGEPFRFANAKAKELLALAVDRKGSMVQMEEAVDLLWEGRAYDDTVKQLYRKAVIYLKQVDEQKNLGFFVSNRGSFHVIPSKADCDYFRLMDGDSKAAQSFGDEYLTDYSWSESTLARIERMLGRI